MPATIKNPTTSEVVVFDKLHVDEFTVKHVRSKGSPPRGLFVRATAFGTQSNGDRLYAPNTHEEEVIDFDPIIIQQWCARNGKTPQEAMAKLYEYQVKLATQLATGEVDELFLMVAVEMGISKVVEMLGVFDVLEID